LFFDINISQGSCYRVAAGESSSIGDRSVCHQRACGRCYYVSEFVLFR